MRNDMQPGSGVRTIGGMYAIVKEVHDEMILLEVAPGVLATYAKNSIGAVLHDEEYNRIVHGEDETPVVPDDASSLTGADETPGEARIDMAKKPAADDEPADAEPEDVKAADSGPEDAKAEPVKAEAEPKDGKTDGEPSAK
jgi:preprotein translocase subunit YajC